MGMFDYIRCAYPLPDGFDGMSLEFQTKDTPDQFLEHYLITEDGRLIHRHVERQWVEDPDSVFGGHLREVEGTEEWREVEDFHGDVEFYASNICASGPDGYATDDDSPPFFREYTARFTDGRVARIQGGLATDRFAGREARGRMPRGALRRMWRERNAAGADPPSPEREEDE